MKMQPSPSFQFTPGESLPSFRHVLFLCPMYHPLLVQGYQADLMYYLATTTLFGSFFKYIYFFLPVPSPTLLSPDWFTLSCPPNPLLFPVESGFDCTMEKKICHFIIQYNQERMCPAPTCPFGGNIAMLQSFNCANRVGGSQRQCRTWNCVIINFSGLSIFHSD